VVAPNRTTFTNRTFKAAIDGFEVRGGVGANPGAAGPTGAAVVTQGGGIYVDGYSDGLSIRNNEIHSNNGAYGGAVRVGTPEITQNHNWNLRLANNRIYANGGSNLAGAVGVFQGSNGYRIDHNDLCGNFSAEYGGAITHYGLSPNGSVDHNRIWFNRSYDEGGGITVAGEMPSNPALLTTGSGAVNITANLIEANLANDDGGGIRLLMVDGRSGNTFSAYRVNVVNNTIADNISTHEGGGIAIDDATNVTFVDNTVVRNVTTATAATSNGQPAPAGLATAQNSALLQSNLAATAPRFSKPTMFNNVFWDNRAGSYSAAGIQGIGMQGDNGPIRLWDFGMFDRSYPLHPTNTVYDSCTDPSVCTDLNQASIDNPGAVDGNLLTTNPLTANPLSFIDPFQVGITVMPWRTQPTFIGNQIVAANLPVTLMGNYHLAAGSAAIGAGAQTSAGVTPAVTKPADDIDGDPRPASGPVDAGSDQRVTP
jgi:hypothetical protein